MRRFFIITGALILISAAMPFAVYIWPTKYRYDRIRLGEGYEFPVRIDRLTGEAEHLTAVGWRPLSAPRRSAEEILGLLSPTPRSR
jgi:hypothetical protein